MKNFFTLLLCLISLSGYSQKSIVVSGRVQQVPKGKKWIIPVHEKILIEVDYGVLNAGSLCNARFLSEPHYITGIAEGEYGFPNIGYAIRFKDFENVAYANRYTFSITPDGFHSIQGDVLEENITFIEGQKLYTVGCLSGIQVIETDLTQKDLSEIKRKKEEEALAEQRKREEAEKEYQRRQEEFFHAVRNTDTYFPAYQLTNSSPVQIIYPDSALVIIDHAIRSLDPDFYSKNYSWYKHSYELVLFFSRHQKLDKIEVYYDANRGQDQADFTLPQDFVNQLADLMSLSQQPVISQQGQDYRVNSRHPLKFEAQISSQQDEFRISKNKKGHVKVIAAHGIFGYLPKFIEGL